MRNRRDIPTTQILWNFRMLRILVSQSLGSIRKTPSPHMSNALSHPRECVLILATWIYRRDVPHLHSIAERRLVFPETRVICWLSFSYRLESGKRRESPQVLQIFSYDNNWKPIAMPNEKRNGEDTRQMENSYENCGTFTENCSKENTESPSWDLTTTSSERVQVVGERHCEQ